MMSREVVFAVPELLHAILGSLPDASLFAAGKACAAWRAAAEHVAAGRPRWRAADFAGLCAGEGSAVLLLRLRGRQAFWGIDLRTSTRLRLAAVREGSIEALRCGQPLPHNPWTIQHTATAAYSGHLDVLKWLRAQDPPCPWDWAVCEGAASRGDLEMLQWARSGASPGPPAPWDVKTCASAAQGGHLEVLRWAHSRGCYWDRCRGCEKAALEGHE